MNRSSETTRDERSAEQDGSNSSADAVGPAQVGGAVTRAARSRRRRGALVLALAFLFTLSGLVAWVLVHGRPSRRGLETERVSYHRIPQDIELRGDLEPAETSDIVCRVKSLVPNSIFSTSISWVIGEGTKVKRGQLLVQLDDSGFREDLATRQVTLEQARSDWLIAEENLKIVRSQNESDIRAAEVAFELAGITLRKYVEADYEQAHTDVEGRLAQAEADVQMWRERVAYTRRMVRKGFVGTSQEQAEQNKLAAAEDALQGVRNELHVLERFGRVLNETDLRNKAAEARFAVDRVKKQARAKEAQARADRLSKQLVFEQTRDRCRELEEQIANCRLVAPQEGMVLYFTSDQLRYARGQQGVIAQGETVTYGQKLLRVTQLQKMVVRTYIQEGLIARVHSEDREHGDAQESKTSSCDPYARMGGEPSVAGQPSCGSAPEQARIRLDAFPGQVLHGHVKKVATVGTGLSRSDSNVYFLTFVAIDDHVPGLRPNMSAHVTVLVDDAPAHVLTVPVDAILPGVGDHRQCFVLTGDGPKERDIVVGAHNASQAEVRSGLQEGEEVVVNPEEALGEQGRELPPGEGTHHRAHP
jgi:multidrug resistance efflux pump